MPVNITLLPFPRLAFKRLYLGLLSTKKINIAFLLATLAMWGYVVARAVLIDITHDEAYTFHNVKRFWYVEALCTGNTHWINSATIKLVSLLGCERLWQIRWFSLTSALVFFSVVFAWIRSVKELWLKTLIFAALLLNPYVLDYFALARGYASGLMFQALALFFLVKYLRGKPGSTAFPALFFAGLSVIANWGFSYFFAAFGLFYFYKIHVENGRLNLASPALYRDLLFSAAVAALFARAYVFMMTCSGDVVGAGTAYLNEAFHVCANGLLYNKVPLSISWLNASTAFFFTLFVSSAAYGLLTYKKHGDPVYYCCSALLLLILGITCAGHLFVGTLFPLYRSALFIFPTSAVCFVGFLRAAVTPVNVRKTLAFGIGALMVLNFAFSINFTYVFDFQGYSNLRQSFDALAEAGARRAGLSPELYGGFINYYQMTDRYSYPFSGERLNTCSAEGWEKGHPNNLAAYDYLALSPPYDLRFYQKHPVKLKVVRYFSETGVIVLKVED